MQKKINFVLFIFLTCLCSAQSSFELQKLEDFAKIYGVVRYFHPSDEAADINWNTEYQCLKSILFYSTQKINFSPAGGILRREY
ncbi:MAG: hypothetical protein LBT29_06470 [Flavobacteriaceae bacterium]|jgi:hypothetical protein|nr:hypothetical protein [Flavobacteriaceae bacterium]